MGTLTYDSIKTEITAALGNRTQFDADRLLNIVNLAQMRIARIRRWEELESVLEGNFVITNDEKADKFLQMPSHVRDVYTFRIITSDGKSRKLTRRSYRFMDKNIPEPEYYDRGDAIIYTVFQDKAEMWRVPEDPDHYILRLCKWPTPFTGDVAQLSDFDNKDDMLVALSVSWCMQSLGRLDDAGRWWVTFNSMLSDAAAEDAEEPDQLLAPGGESAEAAGSYWKDPFIRTVR